MRQFDEEGYTIAVEDDMLFIEENDKIFLCATLTKDQKYILELGGTQDDCPHAKKQDKVNQEKNESTKFHEKEPKNDEEPIVNEDIQVEGSLGGDIEGHNNIISTTNEDAIKELDETKERLKEMEKDAIVLREVQGKIEKKMGIVQNPLKTVEMANKEEDVSRSGLLSSNDDGYTSEEVQ